MQLRVTHTTRYEYEQPVSYALQKVRLRPVGSALQNVLTWVVNVGGGKIEAGYTDHHGNHVDLVSATPGVTSLELTAQGVVETNDLSGVLGPVQGPAPLWHFVGPTRLSRPGEAVMELSGAVRNAANPLDGLHSLSANILEQVPYKIGETDPGSTAEEALAIGHGVCQDHAHIFIAASRAAGVPARYVSGYLHMEDRTDQDASHAWAEAWVDGLGWVGFDVSNGVSPDQRHVRIAIGRDAHEAAPVSGLRMGDGDEAVIVSLQVQQ